MNTDQTIFVVDDEPDVRAALSMLIRSVGLKPEIYENPQAYLDAYDPERAGCLVLDMRMPGMSGLDLQEKLANMGLHPPIIMISGHGEIPNAVQAVKSGAIDFLQKPVGDQLLLDRIQQALRIDPDFEEVHMRLATSMEALGRFKGALSHYSNAVRLSPRDVVAVNNFAWLLATCPLGELRDGARALQLAGPLAKSEGTERFTLLDTLAAAHAEVGQFDRAVRCQQRAVQLAPGTLRADLRRRLKLYKQGKPYRETAQR